MSEQQIPLFQFNRDEIAKRAAKEALPANTWAMWHPTKVGIYVKEVDERNVHKAGHSAIEMRVLPLAVDGDLSTEVGRYGVRFRLYLPVTNTTLKADGTLLYPAHRAPDTAGLVAEFLDASELCKLPARASKGPDGLWYLDGKPNPGTADRRQREAERAVKATEYICDFVSRGIKAMEESLSKVVFYGQSEVDQNDFGSVRNLRPSLPAGATYGPVE